MQSLASYVSIAFSNNRSYEVIQEKNQQITDSIRYAYTIQTAVLPSPQIMNEGLNDYFVIYKPKDIVSGDFYWYNLSEDKIFLAVADCTGHGVPG
ncbi:MAG: histidine kinase, partial [Flammeovirgaceae bacterium]|nr:histidine kinase [Flammeovirgaceae bacterium]